MHRSRIEGFQDYLDSIVARLLFYEMLLRIHGNGSAQFPLQRR
jgi:hypothetical protein